MLTKRIVVCMDVKEGRIVKGVHFVNLRDAGDPVEAARLYSEQGADEIVFLDITATVDRRGTMLEVVEKTAAEVFIPLTVGGGIREEADIQALLKRGADKVSINTAAVKEPQLLKYASQRFGSQCIVVAIDAKRAQSSKLKAQRLVWEVYIDGGRTPTGIDVLEWARKIESLGAGEILLTSMDKDGTKDGYDLELTKTISQAVNIPVIASGGAGALEHLYHALVEGEADAVLAASIFHYNEYSIKQAKKYLKQRGITVRQEIE